MNGHAIGKAALGMFNRPYGTQAASGRNIPSDKSLGYGRSSLRDGIGMPVRHRIHPPKLSCTRKDRAEAYNVPAEGQCFASVQ